MFPHLCGTPSGDLTFREKRADCCARAVCREERFHCGEKQILHSPPVIYAGSVRLHALESQIQCKFNILDSFLVSKSLKLPGFGGKHFERAPAS